MSRQSFILLFAFLGIITLISVAARSQTSAAAPRHRVVIQITMGDAAQWPIALDMVDNRQKSFGRANADIEIVAHMKGLGVLLKKVGLAFASTIATLAQGGVHFAACENSMRKQHVSKEDLLPSVVTVDSGAAEVIRKEEAAWSYLRFGI